MKTLLESSIKNEYRILNIKENLSSVVIKRLKELGIITGNRVILLYKNKISKSGIVRIFSSLISLDYKILSNIEVE